jgi:hypothetical protein
MMIVEPLQLGAMDYAPQINTQRNSLEETSSCKVASNIRRLRSFAPAIFPNLTVFWHDFISLE